MILSEARGLQLFSVVRGGIGLTRRLGAGLQHTVPDRVFGYSPSNRSIARTDWLPPRHEKPCDLARQCQTRHLRLHPLGQQSRVEIMEWSRTTAGSGGRTLEDLFHLMVVISIQTTDLLGFFGTLHL